MKPEMIEKFPILRFFEYDHLPEKLQDVSAKFYVLALILLETQNPNNGAETAAGLRKLLEARLLRSRSTVMIDVDRINALMAPVRELATGYIPDASLPEVRRQRGMRAPYMYKWKAFILSEIRY